MAELDDIGVPEALVRQAARAEMETHFGAVTQGLQNIGDAVTAARLKHADFDQVGPQIAQRLNDPNFQKALAADPVQAVELAYQSLRGQQQPPRIEDQRRDYAQGGWGQPVEHNPQFYANAPIPDAEAARQQWEARPTR